MKFDCNCKNEMEFADMVNEVHDAKWGTNFEVCARLWYKPNGFDKTIMVEYQVTTRECRELVENDDEPDWLTAYEVDDENDDDCSDEIFTETIETNIKLHGLKDAMFDFAKGVFERFYKEEKIMNDNTSAIIEDIKWTLFDDRNYNNSFKFETWSGNSNSFIIKDEDGQEYRVIVEKEN